MPIRNWKKDLNRFVIEFEEEGQKKRTGAKLPTKGHGRAGDQTNSRDTNRDRLYRISGFKLLNIYESAYKDGTYKKKLYSFLGEEIE